MKPISRGRSPRSAKTTSSWRATIRTSTRSFRIRSQASARARTSPPGRRTRSWAKMRLTCFVFSVLLALPAFGVEPTPGVAAVAAYSGADRTERLIAGAKKEGELLLYSSLTQDDQLRLAADFESRYAVKVKFWRGSQAHILQRVVNETRGGRFEFDVIETNAPQLEAIAREKLLQKMRSPYAAETLLPETVPAHGEWMPDRLNLVVYAYNTQSVKAADVPKAWADLLD